jgi:hypothetical protein
LSMNLPAVPVETEVTRTEGLRIAKLWHLTATELPGKRAGGDAAGATRLSGRTIRPARRTIHTERRARQIRGGRRAPDSARRGLRRGSSASRGGPPTPKGGYRGFGAGGAHRILEGPKSGGARPPRKAGRRRSPQRAVRPQRFPRALRIPGRLENAHSEIHPEEADAAL